MPARILDDIMVCGTRAYYTAHYERYRARGIVDMKDSEIRGRAFVEHLQRALEGAGAKDMSNDVVEFWDNRAYYLAYDGLEKEIACKPDATIILLLGKRMLKGIAIEAADTDVNTVLREKHLVPRLLLYMAAIYLYYGVPSATLYVSLSPLSKPPAALFLVKDRSKQRKEAARIGVYLDWVRELLQSEKPPTPKRNPICSHCVYAHICEFKA